MALKDVIIGYAKGDKGDKGDTGERGATGQTGPQGEPGNIADAAITDTQGLDVAKGAKTTAQKLFDAIADRIVNKLVTNDALTTKLADYLLKSAMSSTNIDSTTNVPTSALVYSLMQDVNNNLSNSLQYVHTAKNPFDFNDVNTPAGFHRVNDSDSFKNPPLEIQNNANINYGNIFVCKSNENSDTLSMTFYPYDQNTIFIKTANFTSWKGKGWTQLVSKSDLLRFSRTYISGDSYADAKNLSIPPGIYSVNPDYKNIPETTYGFLEIVADSTNNWRLIKFIPTNIKSYYLMFYNGYDKTWSGWAHFASTT